MTRSFAGLLLLAAAAPAAAQTAADTASPAVQEIATIRMGQTRNGVLEPGDYTMGDGTWADVWYVEATAGQRLVVELRSRRFDAYLQFLDPWGNMLQENDDGAGGGDARITITVRDAGRYQIVVNNFGDTPATGGYTLALRQ